MNIMGFLSVIFILALFIIYLIAKFIKNKKIRYVTARLLQ
jgi:hypothetical protein